MPSPAPSSPPPGGAPGFPARLAGMRLRCPGQCTVCRNWSARPVCSDCLQRYARPLPRCWTCALPLPASALGHARPRCGACLSNTPPLDRCIVALDYVFPWDGMLQRFKFHHAIELRGALLDRLEQTLAASQPEEPDLLLATPLGRQRLKERGYNQSLELARVLARRRGLRCPTQLLLRVRETAPQTSLSATERRANVKGAFAIEPRRLGEVEGKRIALIDDVMTTGATLHELARVLRRAGAVGVQGWVVARTPV